MSTQKVHQRKFIGFTKPMCDALAAEKQRIKAVKGHATETEALEGLILGRDKFMPGIEAWIESRVKATGFSRPEVIQIALLDIIKLQQDQRGPSLDTEFKHRADKVLAEIQPAKQQKRGAEKPNFG